MLRVALADDDASIHDIVARLLKASLDCVLVGQAYDGVEAVNLCQHVKPDLLLLDLLMPRMSGMEAAAALKLLSPELRIIALTASDEYEHIRAMLEAGASGYLVKSTLHEDLIATIIAVQAGQRVFSPQVVEQLLSPPPASPEAFNLTERELEVLRLMGQGYSNAQLALSLDIAVPTVSYHLANILRKLQVETRSEALVVAARAGLI